MKKCSLTLSLLLCSMVPGCNSEQATSMELEPPGPGPYSVGSTNMEVAAEYADMGDEAMHGFLLGLAEEPDKPRYIGDLLKYPESAWVIDVPVPDEPGCMALPAVSPCRW